MESGNRSGQDELHRYLVILRCQAGDEQAFGWLYDRFHPRTLRYLKGLLKGEEAWDVQQEVWLKVYRQISQLDDPRSFRTWLYRLTRNQALDHLRHTRRRSELLEAAAREWDSLPPNSGGEGEGWMGAQTEELESALEQLTDTHREALLLKYREGMNYEEMAVIIGCPVGTIRSRIHYAKQQLESILMKVFGGNKEYRKSQHNP